jgi:hypothetical protein
MRRLKIKNVKNQLKTNLSQFGLNPLDWTLELCSKNKFKIINLNDENILFLGEFYAERQKIKWKQISLLSL